MHNYPLRGAGDARDVARVAAVSINVGKRVEAKASNGRWWPATIARVHADDGKHGTFDVIVGDGEGTEWTRMPARHLRAPEADEERKRAAAKLALRAWGDAKAVALGDLACPCCLAPVDAGACAPRFFASAEDHSEPDWHVPASTCKIRYLLFMCAIADD